MDQLSNNKPKSKWYLPILLGGLSMMPPVLADPGQEPVLRPPAQTGTLAGPATAQNSQSAIPVLPTSTSTVSKSTVTTGSGSASTVTTSTSTTTTSTSTSTSTATSDISQTDPMKLTVEKLDRVRKDKRAACQMARYHWLDKAAAGNPLLIQSICNFHGAANILVRHPRLGEIAEQDHYLCRRLTKWKGTARTLASRPEAERVIALDPQGAYSAVKKDRRFARILAKNPMFDQMITENPDLAKLIAQYM